ncbi:hypothetical protein IG631_10382 [Alternaria alternata]|nr:hypothetical protein IG631_10382 [Alternaria alternata]
MAGAAQNGVNGDANGAPSSYAAKYDLAPHFIGGNNLKVASPGKVKDFVAAHDGHTVITNVRENPASRRIGGVERRRADHHLPRRSSLRTTVLPQSRKSAQCGNGPTRLLAMSERFNSPSWRRPRISRPMQSTSAWQTNMLR